MGLYFGGFSSLIFCALARLKILVDLYDGRHHILAHIVNAVCEQLLVVIHRAEYGDGDDALSLVRAVLIDIVEQVKELLHLDGVILPDNVKHYGVAVVEEEILGQELTVFLTV